MGENFLLILLIFMLPGGRSSIFSWTIIHELVWYGHYIDDILIIRSSDPAAVPHLIKLMNNKNLYNLKCKYKLADKLYLVFGSYFGCRCCIQSYYHKILTLKATSCHPNHTI